MNTKQSNISAVVIMFHPDLEKFETNIRILHNQVREVILVDNSENINYKDWFSNLNATNVSYIHNGANMGVSKAQNVGITRAIENKADYVLIMDQDSKPAEGMVSILLNDLLYLKSRGFNVGIIGPTPINEQTQQPYEPRFRKRKSILNDSNLLIENEIISSGSLIPIFVLNKVGLMDEMLFIDGVDHEWCWRAGEHGFMCIITKNATLEHMLGEGDKKLLGIRVAVPSSFRVYYQYRNYFYLLRKSYVPAYWKILNTIKYIVKFFYYPIFISPRLTYLKNSIKGIREGLFLTTMK
jgi:rhamnosyltransferase